MWIPLGLWLVALSPPSHDIFADQKPPENLSDDQQGQ